ncbi:hypothetical protein SLEP1_g16239 [Rubroshorea leprosula]|uniref:Galactose oxidase n=1 Tax=Rubroshorea leprosula TaxID=152421 RepID=A0AAV5IZH2_9ROSI|nr:hypothetical protein SLEP1_g16239 [Rubroshorea leprosula]
MHMQLLPNSAVIAFDRTNSGNSNISLPDGKCIKFERSLDCTAHSIEFYPANRSVRPLSLWSDTWCSSGALSQDGVLVQSGGYHHGGHVVRYFDPWKGSDADWMEDRKGLIRPRWYASNQILPNGKIIVVGGRNEFNYEFIPKTSDSDHVLYPLGFLQETLHTKSVQDNLYPFTHLAPDGNLFIFANDRAILLDYEQNKVIKKYPVLPGGYARNYPSTGSSVLLPLKLSSNSSATLDAEVLICGGSVPNSYSMARVTKFLPATRTCGRLSIMAANPNWEIEEMPFKRVLGDMILLPTGDVLIVNGVENGSAGWEFGRVPVLNPVLYHPNKDRVKNGSRFQILSPSSKPRVYHSSAILLPDGRVLIGGSNAHEFYNFTALFPTDISLEAFYPPYLNRNNHRPRIGYLKPGNLIGYNQKFSVEFWLNDGGKDANPANTYVTMVAPSFTTHSFAMNQRLLVLALDGVRHVVDRHHAADVNAPVTASVAPPGFYLLFLVHEGVPSRGVWVQIK